MVVLTHYGLSQLQLSYVSPPNNYGICSELKLLFEGMAIKVSL